MLLYIDCKGRDHEVSTLPRAGVVKKYHILLMKESLMGST